MQEHLKTSIDDFVKCKEGKLDTAPPSKPRRGPAHNPNVYDSPEFRRNQRVRAWKKGKK